MINVKNLNKYYNKGKNNEIHVVSDTSFELPDTGLVTFLGESGSGKTTLLNVIGGLDKATGRIDYGDIKIKNYQMSKIDKYRRNNIGYIFQNYNIIPDITVYENLRVALEIIGITDPKEVDKRIEYALTAVGMYKYRKKLAYALSGGQQQRVSIARALIKESKIIIADEPTGNLDSKNTVEVMNILKKISKNSLVLLVTHEKRICDFYSDIVFTVSDGKITGRIEQAGSGATLTDDDQNKIYKGDLEYKKLDNELGSIEVYSNDEIENLNVKLYVKNGTIYLDSNKPIKLLNQSGVTIVDGKKEVLTSSDDLADEFGYNPEFNKGSNRGAFSAFKRALLASWARLQPGRKRTKVIYGVMILLGSFFALALVLLINLEADRDIYSKAGNDYIYTVEAKEYSDYYSTEGAIDYLYKKGDIDFILSKEVYYRLSKQISLTYSIKCQVSAQITTYDPNYAKLALGRAPANANEIVLSKKTADDIINKNGKIVDYSTLLGATIEGDVSNMNGSIEYTLVGLTDDDYNMMYVNKDALYLSFLYGTGGCKYHYIPYQYYDVASGRTPLNDNEILAREDSGLTVGSTVDGNTIVGLYVDKYQFGFYDYISTEQKFIDEFMNCLLDYEYLYADEYFYFTKDDAKKAKEYLDDSDYDMLVVSTTDTVESDDSNNKQLYILAAIVAGISALFIYFTMRSKMISDIYTIGVYRSLGMSRRKIFGQFLLDTFIVGTFTTMVGYFLGYIIYLGFSTLSNEMLSASLLATNVGMLFAGAGVLYVIVLITGTLPIVTLLHKTPKEICSKYDI